MFTHGEVYKLQMGCSKDYGPLLVIDCITTPIFQGYQNGTLLQGTTQISLAGAWQSFPSALWVCYDFVVRDRSMVPKKELHRRAWVASNFCQTQGPTNGTADACLSLLSLCQPRQFLKMIHAEASSNDPESFCDFDFSRPRPPTWKTRGLFGTGRAAVRSKSSRASVHLSCLHPASGLCRSFSNWASGAPLGVVGQVGIVKGLNGLWGCRVA